MTFNLVRVRTIFAAILAVACFLAPSASAADGRNPGSVLIYPIHRSGGAYTIISITNTNLTQETMVEINYVNVLENPSNPLIPLACSVNDLKTLLTAEDTRSALTMCDNMTNAEGYVVVSAQDPDGFDLDWDFDYLAGSAIVVGGTGTIYGLNAIPFEALKGHRMPTQMGDETLLDFNDIEYEGIPDELYIDNFVAVSASSLVLINLSGGAFFDAAVGFDIFNDNEYSLSTTIEFRCWFEEPLEDLSLVFSDQYLANNTPNDPFDLDITCDNDDDFETGWARIRGKSHTSNVSSCPDAALLGAITAGPDGKEALIDGGHLLWESVEKQFDGEWLSFRAQKDCEDEVPPPDCVIITDPPLPICELPDLMVDFSVVPDPDVALYEWDFDGDGAVDDDTGPDPAPFTYTTAGTFTATLTVTGPGGVGTCTAVIKINTPPTANAGVDISVPVGGFDPNDCDAPAGGNDTEVCFDGSLSTDNNPGREIVSFEWDFDDDGQFDDGVGDDPCFTFNGTGTFTVGLKVTDDCGAMDTDEVIVEIFPRPVCSIEVAPDKIDVGGTYTFTSTSFDPEPGGSIVDWAWDTTGNGVPDRFGEVVMKKYNNPGDKTVTLTITDDDDVQVCCEIIVPVNDLPVCVIDADKTNVSLCDESMDILLDASGSTDDGTIDLFEWDFDGDGVTDDIGEMVTFTPPGFGTFTVSLKITDDCGAMNDPDDPNCEIEIVVDPTPGFVSYIGSEIEFHCPGANCAGVARGMIDAVYNNSCAPGDDVLAIGFDTTPNSIGDQAILSWFAGPDAGGPPDSLIPSEVNVPNIVRANTATAVNNEMMDLSRYRMIIVASYEGYIPGQTTQAVINAMNANAGEIAEFTLMNGGGLFCLALAPAPDLVGPGTPPVLQNEFDWSPVVFDTVRCPAVGQCDDPNTYRFVCPAPNLTSGFPVAGTGTPPTGFQPILGFTSNPMFIPEIGPNGLPETLRSPTFCIPNALGSLGHQDWEYFFVDPSNPASITVSGLRVLAIQDPALGLNPPEAPGGIALIAGFPQ